MSLYDTYMEYVKPVKGSTRFHRWAIISVTNALLERRCWLPMGALGTLYPNLYIVLCGEPGTGKSKATEMATDFIYKYNESLGPTNGGIKFGPDVVTPAALIESLSAATKTIKAVPYRDGPRDIEQSAIYLHSSELENLTKDIGGGSLTGDLLNYYDCRASFVKRTVKGGQVNIPGPVINLLGDTTPTYLQRFLPREAGGTGLTARIIFATEFSAVEKDPFPADGNMALADKILFDIRRIHRLKGPFSFDKEARDFFGEFFKTTQNKMYSISGSSFMRHYYARKHVHALKVSMGLSAGRDSSLRVTIDDIERAVSFLEEAEPFMSASFGVQDTNRMTDKTNLLLQFIPFEPARIEESDLFQRMWLGGLFPGGGFEYNNSIDGLQRGKLIKVDIDGQKRYYSRRLVT